MVMAQTRRRFLAGASLAGGPLLVRAQTAFSANDALETTSVRIVNDGSVCIAPLFAAEELLQAEGFTNVRYVKAIAERQHEAVIRGELDFCVTFLSGILAVDSGAPIVVLAGVHAG